MIGAELGGAGGSLLEEGIEGLAGVSKQTAGEIARDAAIEGGISALGEGVQELPEPLIFLEQVKKVKQIRYNTL